MFLRLTQSARRHGRIIATLAAVAMPVLWGVSPDSASAQAVAAPPLLSPGDAIVTGFSGIIPPSVPPAPGVNPIDLTFINPGGQSMQIERLQPNGPPSGQLIGSPAIFSALARDVGQVFAVTLDDAIAPNIYLGATSIFGLQIVVPDPSGALKRVKTGQPGAQFMEGQWGAAKGGTAGSIYRVDGSSGAITLFTTIGANAGPGLGDVVYDRASHQFFVSDLDTGLIYRLDSTGLITDTFDHGVAGRPTHALAPVADDGSAMDITSPAFKSEDPSTWGYTPKARMVWGMAMHNGRLYYAAADGPQIWSVGIRLEGTFAGDPRWELDVAGLASTNPVSDMLFDTAGRMVLAQRGAQRGSYDYSVFAEPLKSSVVRYRREIPSNPSTPGTWVPDPEEYAIGFRPESRNTTGGIALGYAYDKTGSIRSKACREFLWTTGDSLRDNPALAVKLDPGGPAIVHGLQGNGVDLVRPANDPPFSSYFTDYDGTFGDPGNQGHLGDVEIWAPCEGGLTYLPPYFPPPPSPPPSNLTIYKQAEPHACLPDGFGGWACLYTIRVSNTGSTIYWGPIGVDDWLPATPAGATMTFDLQPPWSCGPSGPSHYQCTYPPVVLFPGEGIDLYVTAHVPAAGLVCHLTNGARIYRPFGFPDANPTDDVAFAAATVPNPLCPPPSGTTTNLKLDKDALTTTCVDAGASWVCGYVVTITNAGLGNYTGNIVFTDTLSVGTPILAVGPGWLCTIPGPVHTCTLPGAAIPGGVLHPGEFVQVQLWISIPKAGFSVCFVNNQAKIVAAPGGSALNLLPGDDSDSAVAAVPVPGCKPPGSTNLSIKKTAYLDGCYPAGPNWACYFTVTVKNESLVNDFVGAISFDDTFVLPPPPSPTAFWPGCVPAGGGFTCSAVGTLHPGETWSTIAAVLAPDDGTVCSIVNMVTLTVPPGGSPQNTSAADDHSWISIPVPSVNCPNNLSITKTKTTEFCAKVPGGWNCSFNVVVKNTGPGAIPGPITINEMIPAGLGFLWDAAVVACAGPPWTCVHAGGLASGAEFAFAVTIQVPDGYPVPFDPANPAAPDKCKIPNAVGITIPVGLPFNGQVLDDFSLDTARIDMVPDPAAPPGAAPVPCDPPSLKIEKIADPELCTKTASGWDCSYTIKLTSLGPDPYHGTLEVDEKLPPGATLKTFSAPWTCAGAPPTVHCSHPYVDLAVGDSRTLKVTIAVGEAFAKRQKCEIVNEVQTTVSAAALHSSIAARYMAKASAHVPSDVCAPPPAACPADRKIPTPPGGCCPEGQKWNGRACSGSTPPPPPPPPGQACPSDSTGTYPRCVCKPNTHGTPGQCLPNVCPPDTVGKYPDCTTPTARCPIGFFGTPPNCQPIIILQCPADSTGIPPNCKCKERTHGTPGQCQPNVCLPPTTGIWPNCTTPPAQVCPSDSTGIYPRCSCKEGTHGTPGKCQPNVCPPGTVGNYPICVTPCPSDSTGLYPRCTCKQGTHGTPGNCIKDTTPSFTLTPRLVPLAPLVIPTCPPGLTGPNCTQKIPQ